MALETKSGPDLQLTPPWRRAAVLVTVALIAIVGIVLLANLYAVRAEVSRLAERAATYGAIANGAQRMQAALVDAETGLRGYVITQREVYLEPYERGRLAAEEASQQLRAQAGKAPELRGPIGRLEAARGAATKVIDAQVALARRDRGRALAALSSDVGKDAMDAVRVAAGAVSSLARRVEADSDAAMQKIRSYGGGLLAAVSVLFALSILVGALVMWQEWRGLRRLAMDLNAARIRAEEADAAKTRFLALASHDMRQPLHALTLYLAALRRRVDGDQAKQIVSNMEMAAQSLTRMFSGLLDLARIESGVLQAKPRAISLQSVFDDVARELKDDAARTKTELRVVATSLNVHSDPELLGSIIRNLTSNAIKYASGGRVLIGARRKSGGAQIYVIDEGPGIPDDKVMFVFGEFVRLDTVDKRGVDGLGLGLSIAARLAQLLGAKLDVQSTVGKGTSFCVTAPIVGAANVDEDSASSAERRDLTGLSLAVLDDDPLALAAMRDVLRDASAHVSAFIAAAPFVEALKAGARFDLVILDPGLLGDASRLVASIPGFKSPRLLVITGSTDAPTLARLEASRLPWLIKPVQEGVLLQTVQSAARRRRAAPAEEPSDAAGPRADA